MNYMGMKENFERFEIYFNNWWTKNYIDIILIPRLDIIIDKQMNHTFIMEDMIDRHEIYPSQIGIGLSIGWLWFDVYMQLNFKTNKLIED